VAGAKQADAFGCHVRSRLGFEQATQVGAEADNDKPVVMASLAPIVVGCKCARREHRIAC
jgi:hypothetical protein